jgi:general nucleoside transport system ATP-binding protein
MEPDRVQSTPSTIPMLRACGLTKVFPGKIANRDVSLDVYAGEVHALLGENGAGKSTLVNMLSGMTECDGGSIIWKGYAPLVSAGNVEAARHIGMVHQHFSLVGCFTLVQNLMLLETPSILHPFLPEKRVRDRLARLSERFGVGISLDVPMEKLSVGEQQLGELLKALYFDCELLILDEPTAVLTPGEVERLWKIIRNFTARNHAVILIAHKIAEVLAVADKITVLRQGEVVASLMAKETNPSDLAELMVGRQIHKVRAVARPNNSKPVLALENVCEAPIDGGIALKNINLTVGAGEILGIAGVDGNGQTQLFHLIARRRIPDSGVVRIGSREVSAGFSGCASNDCTGRIPDDRQRYGLIMDMSVSDNLMLTSGMLKPYSRFGLRCLKNWKRRADELAGIFDVRCTGVTATARSLSGGNQQKLILARELSDSPKLLVVANPTRGLDIGAIEMIHEKLLVAAAGGCAILLVSSDLDEVLSLSHRVAVMHGGRIMGEATGPNYDINRIGLWMAGQEAS